MFTLDFLIKDETRVIHTPTQADFIAVLSRLNQKGIRSAGNQPPLKLINKWTIYNSETCLMFNGGRIQFCDKTYCKGCGFAIITRQQISKPPRKAAGTAEGARL